MDTAIFLFVLNIPNTIIIEVVYGFSFFINKFVNSHCVVCVVCAIVVCHTSGWNTNGSKRCRHHTREYPTLAIFNGFFCFVIFLKYFHTAIPKCWRFTTFIVSWPIAKQYTTFVLRINLSMYIQVSKLSIIHTHTLEFVLLKTDRNWMSILNKIQKKSNGNWGICAWRA